MLRPRVRVPRATGAMRANRFLARIAVPLHLLALSVLVSPPSVGAQDRPTWLPDEILVGFRAGVSGAQAEAVYRAHGAAKIEELEPLNVHRIRVPPSALEAVEAALSRQPEVKFVERNRLFKADMTATDPYYSSQWHLPKISAPQSWDLTQGAPDVVIAVIDTGVDPTHPDLATKLVAGYNFYDQNTDTSDVGGHGTKVAGAAAAIGNNATGIAGVSWYSRIMPLRVADPSGVAYTSTIANALTWAADRGARVMNISFSPVASSSTITTAAQYARNKGGVVVSSAGNCGCVEAINENPYLLSVSATDPSDILTSWSSQGNYVDLSAPGLGILTTTTGGGYASVSGTSFSSPITAGVVALMMAANPSLTPPEIETLLKANADDLGATGWDPAYGYGRVNAWRAVAAAAASAPAPDLTRPSVSIISPGPGATVSGTISVSVSASDDVGVSRVDLYVDGALYASDGASPYAFSWNTASAANGSHTLVARAYDAAGNEGVSAGVSVNVSNVADTTAPTVSITSVTARGNSLKVSVAASDNVAVSRVDLYVDGSLMESSTSSSPTFSINTKSLVAGTHSVQAKAYDPAGNMGSSGSNVTFVK